MISFLQRNKVFIIVLISTILLIVGGAFLVGGKGDSPKTTSKIIDASILTPDSVYKTSGITGEEYLPASASAKVTLVEFGDYVCPACGIYAPVVKQILSEYSGKVTYVFRNYPLSYHTNAPVASYATLASGLQGKYWQMHDKLFLLQKDWSESQDVQTIFTGYAKDLGLNTDQFITDMGSKKIRDIVEKDKVDGNMVGFTSTPAFYINGEIVTLTGDINQLKTIVASKIPQP